MAGILGRYGYAREQAYFKTEQARLASPPRLAPTLYLTPLFDLGHSYTVEPCPLTNTQALPCFPLTSDYTNH